MVGEGGVDEMLLETMGEKYFSGRAETKVAVEEQTKEPETKIEEPKMEEVKEGEEGPQKDEEEGEKEADAAADGEKGWFDSLTF